MSDRGLLGVEEDEHRALLSLILAGLPERERVIADLEEHLGFTPDPVNDALLTLARARERPLKTMRPMVLRALIRAARREPGLISENSEALALFHEALAHEAQVPSQNLADIALRLQDALEHFSRPDADIGGDDSPEVAYQMRTAAILNAPPETTTPPTCDDRTADSTSVPVVYTVEAAWRTSTPVSSLLPWLDPQNWPACDGHVFFKDMKVESFTPDPSGNGNWEGDFVETVEIVPGHPIQTWLSFRHRRFPGPNNELMAAATDYWLTPTVPPNEINPDHGQLLAQRRSTGAAPFTDALVTKTYAFTNPAYANWPTVACDTFFGELAVRMASNCAAGYTAPDSDDKTTEDPMPPNDTSKATSTTTPAPTVDALVDQYVTLAQTSIKTYADLTRKAAKRVSGEKPEPEGTWVDDIATFWSTAARDAAMCLNLHAQLLQATQPKPGTPATPPPAEPATPPPPTQ